MVGALDHQQLHLFGLNAHSTEQFTVKHLHFAAGHRDQNPIDLQAGAGADVGLHAGHHRAFQLAVIGAQGSHREAALQRRVTGLARESGHGTAQSQLQHSTDTGRMGLAGGLRVEQQTQGHLARPALPGTLLQQGVQHAGGVAVATSAWVVLRIRNDHRRRGHIGRGQCLGHRFAGGQDIRAPLARGGHPFKQTLHGSVCLRTMAPHHGAAFGKVRRRKAHAKT